MKKSTSLACLALLVAASFTSCNKDEDDEVVPVVPTKTELITAKNWRITSFTYKEGNAPVQDVYALYGPCSRDDFYKFNADKTFLFDEGATRCSSSDPQTMTSGWDINADGSILLLLEMKGSTTAELYNIQELTDTKLRISQTFTGNGYNEVTDITFAAF
jgi:Lipocalin-like domain